MELDKGDLLLVADSCDAMRRVGDLLNESSRAGVFIMRLPWKRDELAVEFMASEVLRLIGFLEKKGIDVNLLAGIERFNDLIDHVRSHRTLSFCSKRSEARPDRFCGQR
jgi:hypothetical protein